VSNYRVLREEEKIYGLGEKTGDMNRKGKSYVHWNTDHFAYGVDTDPLYSSIPFFIGVNHSGHYGIFVEAPGRSLFNFGASSHRLQYFTVEGKILDYYFIFGEHPLDILQNFSMLTGTLPLPPKWALGYQQSRYSYYPDYVVMDVAKTFRQKKIPADVIYLDIHYMDSNKAFTWDLVRFPDPTRLINDLKKLGFKVITILDPGIKNEKGYLPCDSGLKKDVFIKYPDGENYAANVWPGPCFFPDYSKDATRKWWRDLIAKWMRNGLGGLCNDMNEPASWGQTTPELVEMDFDGHPRAHNESRNVYGALMARASSEGMQKAFPDRRFFNLTRAAYAGSQRHAAVWTGDNVASAEYMMLGIRMVNSFSLSGISFAGFDMGGFFGESDAELYARWISLAAFTPLFRGHSIINSRSSEPWSFGEAVEDIARNYIGLRYRLMPYIYSCIYKATQDGTPFCRPLMIDFPQDEQVYDVRWQNQYLFGPSLLIIPAMTGQAFTEVYLPPGLWYDLYTSLQFPGGRTYIVPSPRDRLPVFVKGGSVLLMQSLTQNFSLDKRTSQVELHYYDGAITDFVFQWYDDDGISNAFKEGAYYLGNIQYNHKKNTLEIVPLHNQYPMGYRRLRLFINGLRKDAKTIYNKIGVRAPVQTYRFKEPVSNFDPLYQPIDYTDEVKDVLAFDLHFQQGRSYVWSLGSV